ncbi:MAG: substrate-binding domain-containing protein, partial [Pseudomonadota bacterium]
EEILSVFSELDIPVATVANGADARKSMDINVDDQSAAAAMTRHLVAFGHSRIGFVRGPSDQVSSIRRETGFRMAMDEAGLSVFEQMCVNGQFTYRSGVDAAEQLLALEERPTAIFASNDDMAAAVIGVAHRHGLSVPEDLSVVGFDNSPSAISVWPELTTMDQPVSAMAASAFNLVLSAIDERIVSREDAIAEQVHPCKLVKRESSGICRKQI